MSDEKKNFIGKKRTDSNGKEVYLIEIDKERNKIVLSQNKFKDKEEFLLYISSLENPYYISGEKIIDLTSSKNQDLFFLDKANNEIYENRKSINLLSHYYSVFKEFTEYHEDNHYRINYPISLDRICFDTHFFLNLTEANLPKFYGVSDSMRAGLSLFFDYNDFQIFHLFKRKECGGTIFIMKMMHRKKEYFIYLDMRKLKQILSKKTIKINNNTTVLLKTFIYYSLFYIHGFYNTLEDGYKRVEKYYTYIWNKIYKAYWLQSKQSFIKTLLNAYVSLFKEYILKYLNVEEEIQYQSLLIVMDHFSSEFDINYIYNIVKDNPKLKFLIVNSLHNKKEIDYFFSFIDNNSFIYNEDYITMIIYKKEGIWLRK